ncbi:MAG: OmpH family outer membrane protein [bacterium]
MRIKLVITMICLINTAGYGLSIPLEGGAGTSQSPAGSMRIGMVDMELIFREFPETRRGQQDLEKEISNAQVKINTKQQEIDALQKEVDEMQSVENETGQLPGMMQPGSQTDEFEVDSSTDTIEITDINNEEETVQNSKNENKSNDGDEQDFKKLLAGKTEEIIKLTDELEKFRKDSEVNLLQFEERKSREILEKLYRILEQIAQEEKLDIILDKNYVLYGRPAVDLTGRLKGRLAGD